EDGQLMTMGTDGAVRVWDIENIVTAEGDESRRFELEPMNELMVGHHVCLTSMVKSSQPDSFIWFAQDSSGAIWKLDLSFTNTTLDPECLFSFHAGPITGLDVSNKSYLMATTALNRSVSVFDFLTNRELTSSRFNQGGTVISWAPHVVSVTHRGGLLVTGFEDGVIRLLELYDPQKLPLVSGRHPKGDAKLRLKQAFKPHNASVTAVAYDQSGKMFATGSSDCTVFFFTVGEKYNPVGFFRVPGPVQALEWSSRFYKENRLLILCQSSQVFEVHSPNPESQKNAKTYHLANLPTRSFKFRSIKSRIKREDEIARRQALKELKEKESKQQHIMQYKEEEEELPPIYIPDHPSRLYCGFYSQPDQFWLSMVHTHTKNQKDSDLCSYSVLETARQKLEKDCLRREAEQKMVAKRKMLSQLQQRSKELLSHNQSLPEHVRLMPSVQTHTQLVHFTCHLWLSFGIRLKDYPI
uniref:Uncharacterized protein n=1 Tax=Mola mola TaxID=94237 RepID=A0A3Q3WFI8_MOLML